MCLKNKGFGVWLHGLRSLLGVGLCALTLSAQAADAWPGRAVTMVVPYPAGGTSDIVARVLSQHLGQALGQTVVVENRPGANGNIGAAAVAKAKADGYTFLLCDVSALAVSPSVYKTLSFNPARDLTGVGTLTFSPLLLAVNPQLGASTLSELIEKAKQKNAQLNFAATSIGSISHLMGLEIEALTGAHWQSVIYKGGAEAISDTIAGHTQLLIAGIPVLLPNIKAQKLNALGVASARRLTLLPDVPTLAEAGLKNFEVGAWQGVFAPAGTPTEIVTRVNKEIARILELPEVKDRFAGLGAETKAMTPAEMRDFFASESRRWADVVKRTNVSND